jgi:anti-sigma factor RsiW
MSPYLDGVLSESQCRELENHLHACALCREELESLRQTVELLQLWSKEELELPPGFDERLKQRLRQIKPPWYRRLAKSGLSLSAAAAILLLVAFSVYGNNFNIFKTASRQQLQTSLSSSTPMAAADNALPESGETTHERAKIMLMDEAPPSLAIEAAPAENAAADTRVFMAEEQAGTEVQVRAEGVQPGTEVQAAPPSINGYDRAPAANGTLSSRNEGEVAKAEEQPASGSQEIPPGGAENPDIAAIQVLEQSSGPDSSREAGQDDIEEIVPTAATELSPALEEGCQALEIVWGKDKVMPEAAAWAAQNKMTAGVFKKNFGCRDAYLVTMGEKTGEGYEVRLKNAALGDENTLVVDIEFLAPDPAGPIIAELNYPYEVFIVPGKRPLKVRAVQQDGWQELPIQECPLEK